MILEYNVNLRIGLPNVPLDDGDDDLETKIDKDVSMPAPTLQDIHITTTQENIVEKPEKDMEGMHSFKNQN